MPSACLHVPTCVTTSKPSTFVEMDMRSVKVSGNSTRRKLQVTKLIPTILLFTTSTKDRTTAVFVRRVGLNTVMEGVLLLRPTHGQLRPSSVLCTGSVLTFPLP